MLENILSLFHTRIALNKLRDENEVYTVEMISCERMLNQICKVHQLRCELKSIGEDVDSRKIDITILNWTRLADSCKKISSVQSVRKTGKQLFFKRILLQFFLEGVRCLYVHTVNAETSVKRKFALHIQGQSQILEVGKLKKKIE